MTESSPALVERAIQMVRDTASDRFSVHALATEARAIVAELPVPVDPDLIEARKIAEQRSRFKGYFYEPQAFFSGARDDGDDVQTALAGIRLGKELALKNAGGL